MQSFVSTKAEVKSDKILTCIFVVERLISLIFVSVKATEGLQGKVGKLKTMYGSGIQALDEMAKELEGNSRSTFVNLNSEVSKHSHALEGVSS